MIKMKNIMKAAISALVITCILSEATGNVATAVNNVSTSMTYVVEKHDADVAYADGVFNGNGSDRWHDDETGSVNDPNQKHLFNVLEIVPTERKGTIGYTMAGHEPFDIDGLFNRTTLNEAIQEKRLTEAELRKACMDALVNPAPGATKENNLDAINGNDQNNIPQCVKELRQKTLDLGTYAFDFESDRQYTGYYKYVGEGNGVYSIASTNGTDPMELRQITYWGQDKTTGEWKSMTRPDIVMVSRFYSNSYDSNIPKSTGKNDYIWQETDTLLSPVSESDNKNIYVQDTKRIKYTNNNTFFTKMLPADPNEYKVSVVTRNPNTVSLEDIEAADLIVMVNPPAYGGDIYEWALKVYNRSHHYNDTGISEEQGIVFYPPDRDLSFDKVLAIYERVAVREDVAFIAGKWSLGVSGKVDSNVKKLMYMLFMVKYRNDGPIGSGRRMFMDFLKSYVNEPGNERLALREDVRYKNNPSDEYSRYMPNGLLSGVSSPDHHYSHNIHPFEFRGDAIVDSYYDENGILVPQYERDTGNIPTRPGSGSPPFGQQTVFAHKTTNWFNKLNYKLLEIEEQNRGEVGYYINENGPVGIYSGEKYKYYLNIFNSKSNTVDYVYIDEETGNFVRSTANSGKWYIMDANGDIDKYYLRQIEWDAMDTSVWPWNIDDHDANGCKGCLKDWFLCNNGTKEYYDYDQGRWLKANTHLYYDYFDPNWGGYYRAYSSIDSSSTYKNQSIVQENDLYKNDGGWIKTALDERTIKREVDDPNHIDNSNKVYYMVNVNVVNGDGVNSSSANKVMYYNEYEKEDFDSKPIPVKFNVRTSTDIDRIEFYKGSTLLVTYNASGSNDVKDVTKPDLIFTQSSDSRRSSKIVLKNDTAYPLVEKVNDDGAEYVYTLSGEIGETVTISGKNVTKGVILKSDLTSINERFKVRVYIKPIPTEERHDEDELILAERSFFELD